MSESDEAKKELPPAELRGSPVEKGRAKLRGLFATKWGIFWIVAGLSLVADQATKIWARADLPVVQVSKGPSAGPGCDIPGDLVPPDKATPAECVGEAVAVIDSFWHWRLSMNQGSAFGLFSGRTGARVFLSIVGIAAVIGMVWMLKKSRADQKVLHWALALVAGGAVGNLIDRIYYGVVTDFILWHLGDYKASPHAGVGRWAHEWPVFNIADVVLVVGVGLMFIDIQKEGKREKALRKARNERAKKQGVVKELT